MFNIKGRIHSIETMGLVDGPGIRVVVFFQGCRLRCRYCHNPDTWNMNGGKLMESAELLEKILRFKSYFRASGGGVTFSGGEPLLQKDFLLEMLKLCKENGISTCLDTSGVGFGDYDEILRYTDLILYDVKHYDSKGYKNITGQDMAETLKFSEALQRSNKPVWIRHVVVPGLTDSDEHLSNLRDYLRTMGNIKKVELLPYHILGVSKYKEMGIPYSLENIDSANIEKTKEQEKKFFSDWEDK